MGETRDRMIRAASDAIRERGVEGTSFTEILDRSGAARGAIYHHFPGGKAELAEAAVRWTGAGLSGAIETMPPSNAPAQVASAFLALVRPVVAESADGSGCAVAAACTERAAGTALHAAAAEVFGAWRSQLAERLAAAGATKDEAAATAALLIATLEGAHVTCRAAGSIEPFDAACGALRAAGLAT